MGAKVTFKIASTKNNGFKADGDISSWIPKYQEGQIIFVEDLGKIYLDFHENRRCYTPDSMNYIGLIDADFDFDPESDEQIKVGGKMVTPKERDVAVHGKKEYMFRNGSWWEIGDEDAPQWNEGGSEWNS